MGTVLGLWVVGCGLWAVGCGLWVVGCGRVAAAGERRPVRERSLIRERSLAPWAFWTVLLSRAESASARRVGTRPGPGVPASPIPRSVWRAHRWRSMLMAAWWRMVTASRRAPSQRAPRPGRPPPRPLAPYRPSACVPRRGPHRGHDAEARPALIGRLELGGLEQAFRISTMGVRAGIDEDGPVFQTPDRT